MLTRTQEGSARLQEQKANMEACIRCGLCLSVCPTYLETRREEESPRGRIALALAVTEGHITLTPAVMRHEENCLVCEACTAVCPAGFHMEPLALAFRDAVQRRRPWRRRLLSTVLSPLAKPALLRFLTRLGGLARQLRLASVPSLIGLGRVEAMLPQKTGRPFIAQGQRWAPATNTSTHDGEAILFAGCVMSTLFPHVHQALIELLTAQGWAVSAPTGQGCCGAIHAHNGLLDDAKEMARRNIQALEKRGDPIAVDSAGCAAFLKGYGRLLQDDPNFAERAQSLATRVRESTELVASRPLPPLASAPGAVTYQEACHLVHAQRIVAEPRALLRAVPGIELRELPERGVCCGSAGVHNLLHREMGDALGQRLARSVRETGASVVVTTNPGCALQLQAHLAGSGVRVRHLLEVLAEAHQAARQGTREKAAYHVS
ncbi:MAG: (Fe-S)-binding protein [Chloroflexi bacterium]|nr:(Fe-S)-binding protein [Chloroflexota bacterium]